MRKRLAFIICSVFTLNIAYAQRNDFVNINFYEADSVAELYGDRTLKSPEKLAEDLTKNLSTDVEKFRAVFRWITNNIHYDYELFLESSRMRIKLRYKKKELQAWQKRFNRKIDQRLLIKKSTICDGYATLLERMSNHVGISCVKVTGYARTGVQDIGKGTINHAWNAVKLNTKWYLCDPTWASSALDVSTLKFHHRFDKNYFLTDPSLFIANHFPADTSWTLLYQKPELSAYLKAPMKYNGYISNRVNTYFPEHGIIRLKREEVVTFKFSSNAKLEEQRYPPHFFVDAVKDQVEVSKLMMKDKDGLYSIDYAFNTRGNYIAHIAIDGQIALSYKVIIK